MSTPSVSDVIESAERLRVLIDSNSYGTVTIGEIVGDVFCVVGYAMAHVPTVTAPDLPPLPESVLLHELDGIAREFDHYEYGLPIINDEACETMLAAIRAALAAERAAAMQEERARCVSIAKDELQWHHECARNCAGDEDAEMHSFGESMAFRIVQNITTPEIPNA